MRLDRFGGPEVLRVVDVDRPSPAEGEALVRVVAAGVNPVDWKVRATGGGGRFGTPPLVLGWDLSGVVEVVADGVSAFAAGDEVFGMPRFPDPAGCYAEYVAAPADQLAAKPSALDHAAAAGLPLAGLTALQVLDLAEVEAGQRVLVHAAAGGVGHLAVQLAKARGAEVVGTARADKHPFLVELGIDQAVDYTTAAFEEVVDGVDVVLDPVGGDYARRSLEVLRPGGVLLMIAGRADEALTAAAGSAGVRIVRHLVHPDGPGLARLADLAERGALQVAVERAFPLDQAAKAHELGERGRTRGKLVLSVARPIGP
ncbi:MAG TPA: NADP-dependent oxidoreductase [Actinomycetes bacterium]